MIQLPRDYLLLETDQGQIIPCSAECVTVELIGDAAASLAPELVQQAASAVLHYFKEDLGQTTVSVGEFSNALKQALQTIGISAQAEPSDQESHRSYDLTELAAGTGELSFFPKLRQEVRTKLEEAPKELNFHNLRGCVKQLVGVKRWNTRCQKLNDQIVEYLRACLAIESDRKTCGLVIR